MSDLTPLEKLDDAVREYFDALEDDGELNGWMMAWQSSKITNDPTLVPLTFSSDFTMAAATSPETAMGLAHLTAARIERQIVFSDPDD